MLYEERILRDLTEALEAAQRMLDTYKSSPTFHRSNLWSIRTQLQQASNAASELIGSISASQQKSAK